MLEGKTRTLRAQSIVEYLNKKASPNTLQALGMYRRKNVAVISLNGRPVTVADVDNFACKVAVFYGRTTGARLVVDQPKMHMPYDFPLPPQWEYAFDWKMLFTIGERSTRLLIPNKLRKWKLPKIHAEFKYNKEDTKWPKTCSDFDRKWSSILNVDHKNAREREQQDSDSCASSENEHEEVTLRSHKRKTAARTTRPR
jgi:hypothetical protein